MRRPAAENLVGRGIGIFRSVGDDRIRVALMDDGSCLKQRPMVGSNRYFNAAKPNGLYGRFGCSVEKIQRVTFDRFSLALEVWLTTSSFSLEVDISMIMKVVVI